MSRIIKIVSFLFILSLAIPVTTFADSAHIFSGGLSGGSMTYQVENSKNTETYYANAVSRWDRHSSKITITKQLGTSSSQLYLRDSKNGLTVSMD